MGEKHKGFKQLNVTANPSGSCHIRVHCEPPTGNDPKAKRARGVVTKNNKLGENSNEVTDELFMTIQNLKRRLPDVVIKGYPDAHRAILKKDDKPDATGLDQGKMMYENVKTKSDQKTCKPGTWFCE